MRVYPCVRCGVTAAELQARPWGARPEDAPAFPFGPFICGTCGALALMDMETGELHEPPPEAVAILRGNLVLWSAIERAQAAARLPRP